MDTPTTFVVDMLVGSTTAPVADTPSDASTGTTTDPLTKDTHILSLLQPTPGLNDKFAIQPSPLGGLGCFALRDICRGDRLLVERPLLRTNLLHLFHELEHLSTAHRKQYDALHAWHPDPRASRAEQIWTTNTFVAGELEGVFVVASRFNHACSRSAERNVDYFYDQKHNVLVLTALKPIPAGTELLISYGSSTRMLQFRYGFTCRCSACAGSIAKSLTTDELYKRMW